MKGNLKRLLNQEIIKNLSGAKNDLNLTIWQLSFMGVADMYDQFKRVETQHQEIMAVIKELNQEPVEFEYNEQ